MNYKVAFIISSVVIMISILLLIAFNINQKSYKTFAKDGYILASENTDTYDDGKSVKYYFEAGTKHKNKYPEKIVFSDTADNKVITDNTGFVHYLDGSIGVLKKSVIINLDGLNSDLLKYYNVFDESILENNNGNYYINNAGKKIKFSNFALKVSDSKYLVVSKELNLKLSDTDNVKVSGYLEINFTDGDIIKLENQEVSYQTISSESSINIGENIKIDLSDKGIYSGGERKLTLSQLAIDSNDNIQITPSDDTDEDTNDNQNAGGAGGSDGSIGTGGFIDSSGSDTGEDTSDSEEETINIPDFSIVSMEVTSNKIDANIKVADESGLLSGNILTKIVENSTGKIAYMKEDSSGTYALEVIVENLAPSVNYTLIMTSDYVKDEITYTRDFVSKSFRTESIGINFEKDYFTKTEMSFTVKTEAYSKVKTAEMVLLTEAGQIVKTVEIDAEAAKIDGGAKALFSDLNPNTAYIAKMYNFLYDGAVISNGFEIQGTYKTLKSKPTFGTTSFIIDKKNSAFTLKVNNISDADNGIDTYKYEIYDARTLLDENSSPIAVIEKSKWGSVDIPVDEVSIFRGVPYTYRLITEFYDNEKYLEYESEFSEVFKMDGVEFPSVRFEPSLITFERIEGTVIITDEGNTIQLDNNIITVTYSDSTGNTNSFTTNGNLSIPLSISGLRANETYTISVYTSINLQDGNQTIDNCYIGSVVVKTDQTKEIVASYNTNTSSVTTAFTVTAALGTRDGVDNILEANTLTGLTFNLYSGQSTSGTLVKSVKKVDRNLQPYSSDLKASYYDNTFQITPEFFGSLNGDMQDEYYTIQIVNAYDYTNYKNNIPIVNDTITVKSNGFIPDLPPDQSNAIEVNAIRNKDAGDKYRADLNPDTIVGYKIKAGYDNAKLYAKYLKYYIYNADTNQILSTEGTRVDVDSTGVINYVEFYLGDGTPYETVDTDFRRGNNYYFTYEAYLDLNFDGIAETKYPYVSEGQPTVVLKSNTVSPPKQQAFFQLYPSTSTSNTMVWKYQFADVDKSLISDNLVPKIGTTVKPLVPITTTDETSGFRAATLTSLSAGFLSINVNQALIKTAADIVERNLVYQYFDGVFSMKTLNFHAQLDVNRIIISVLNYEANTTYVNRIAALKITFTTPTSTIVKDMVPMENDSAIIDLADISSLINQDITISVQAYYDTGITGFETGATTVALQTIKNSSGGGDYLTINNLSNFRGDIIANGSIYSQTFAPTLLKLNNLSSDYTKDVATTCDAAGISYNYEYLILKKLQTSSLVGDGTEIINFNMIIPGVSLLDSTGKLAIFPALRTAQATIKLYGANASSIENDTIFIELYQTDETATESTFIKEMSVSTWDLDSPVNITDLIPKTQYYIKVFANVYDGTAYTRQQLYDIDFKSPTKNYYFSTLSGVNITNTATRYIAVSYNNKYLNITYTLDQIVGYDKIEYELYRYTTDETGAIIKVPVNTEITDDVIFKNQMVKKVNCLPGSDFVFNASYNLIIRPISYITIDGVQQELELDGTVNYDFNLPKLRDPFAGIVGIAKLDSTTNAPGLEFKISVSDTHKIIVDGTYTIKILDDLNNDITPAEYKAVEYSITNLNNTITLNNLNSSKLYRLVVTTYVDRTNNMVDIEQFDTSYTRMTLDDSGIDVGNVYASINAGDRSKIDLTFYNSYKLTDIDEIRYSIYNLSGYAQDNTVAFIPTQIQLPDGSLYYFITLPETLPNEGLYYIEMQFLSSNEIVKELSLEHTYN